MYLLTLKVSSYAAVYLQSRHSYSVDIIYRGIKISWYKKRYVFVYYMSFSLFLVHERMITPYTHEYVYLTFVRYYSSSSHGKRTGYYCAGDVNYRRKKKKKKTIKRIADRLSRFSAFVPAASLSFIRSPTFCNGIPIYACA